MTESEEILTLATDIVLTQQAQIGMMLGRFEDRTMASVRKRTRRHSYAVEPGSSRFGKAPKKDTESYT